MTDVITENRIIELYIKIKTLDNNKKQCIIHIPTKINLIS